MKKEIADLWTEALDSGRFTQRQGGLASGGDSGELTHCCLGVLCELAVEAGVRVERAVYCDLSVCFDQFGWYLPPSVQEWAGVRSSTGHYPGGSLIELNDRGVPFSEIATVIRENVDSL